MLLRFPVLLALLALSFAGCRKLPYAPWRSHSEKPALAAETRVPPAATPAPEAIAEGPAHPAIDRTAEVTVLGYHRFVDKVRHPDTEITPADFEAQMKAVKDAGITVIPLADFLAWRREEKDIPAKSALITIDDGYNVAYSVAWPILKKYGYPFTMFVYTDYIRGGPKSGGGSISWEELAEMRDAGVGIGSHSVSHRNLRGGGGKQGKTGDPAYEQWLWNELKGSKDMIESRLGIKVTAFALPYGLSNEHVREMAMKAGYEMVFTVNGEKLRLDTPAEALGRYMIQANQPKIFTAAMTFREGQGGGASAVATLPTQMVQPVPAENSQVSNPRPAIRASLASVSPIDAGSVTMRISGVGEVPVVFDPQTKMVSSQIASKLEPGQHTVLLSAKTQGRKVEARWTFAVQAVDETHAATVQAAPHPGR
jgi:peptidoglycan/xylan/chitin deacetylase (PgdA/CDA1 family)